MSGLKMYGAKPKRMYTGGLKAKKAYCRGDRVWSAGNIVTYICNGVTYQEEVEEGNTVLSPSTFTPTVEGASFLGWCLSPDDTTVQSSLVMGDEPITLYAIFKYSNISVSAGGKGGEIVAKTLYVDSAKYGTLQLQTDNVRGSYIYARLYAPSGSMMLEIASNPNNPPSEYATKPCTITGTYTVKAESYYAYSWCTATLTAIGKTVVG